MRLLELPGSHPRRPPQRHDHRRPRPRPVAARRRARASRSCRADRDATASASATWNGSSASKLARMRPTMPKSCPAPASKPRTRSDQVASLEQEFRHALGVKVEIQASARGRGKLIIHFAEPRRIRPSPRATDRRHEQRSARKSRLRRAVGSVGQKPLPFPNFSRKTARQRRGHLRQSRVLRLAFAGPRNNGG